VVKLKPGPYDQAICAISRCKQGATHADSTGYLVGGNVPLRDRHWSDRCDEEDKTAERPAGGPCWTVHKAGTAKGRTHPTPDLQQTNHRRTQMAKITTLEIENTMAVKVAEIKPNGEPITTIGGLTAQGKSTALRSVEMLFGGAKSIPAEPLRRGAKKGHIRGEIDGGPDNGGFEVERRLTRKGTSLVVTGREGTPQALMDQIKGGCTQDLGKIARMKNSELMTVVKELVPGLDFSAHDEERDSIFRKRTGANSDLKQSKARLDSTTLHDDAPEAEVSVAELVAELQRRQDVNRRNEGRRAALHSVADQYREAQAAVAAAEKKVEEAKAALGAEKADLDAAATAGRALKTEVAALEDADVTEIQDHLATADDANRKVRENAAHAKLAAEVIEAETRAKDLNRQIDDLDEKKGKAIADAEYPVKGLAVDDETVMLHDFPWEQASQRERLVASAEIVLAQSPELRELLLDEGSAFDDESVTALGEWADKNDAHVWMIVVGDGRGCSVVFHEGELVNVDEEGNII